MFVVFCLPGYHKLPQLPALPPNDEPTYAPRDSDGRMPVLSPS